MKGIGLLLLLIGVGTIAYAFSAPESLISTVDTAIARWAARLPGNETIWLLIGGSGAAVVGMAMLFKRPASSKSGG